MRPLIFSDLPRRVEIFNEEAVFNNMRFSERLEIAKTEKWFLSAIEDKKRKDFVFFTPTNKRIIGLGGFTHINALDKNAELYIAIETRSQGKGFGKQSMLLLCEYGFKVLEFNRIFLFTFLDNQKASRLYERIGFQEEGVLRQHAYQDGVYKDRMVFGLLKEDWK